MCVPSYNFIQNPIETSADENYYYCYIQDNQYESDCYAAATDDQEVDADNYGCIRIINTILSGTARLNVLLPTATILAFTIFAPLLTNDGKCTTLDRWLMGFFLAFSAASCVFFSFTDSFRSATGRLYYGVATFGGIRTFGGGHIRPCVPSDFRLRWGDMFHATLAPFAFLAFALFHSDVLSCYHLALPRKFVNIVPLVVGFVTSVLFSLFPSRRRGIGYPFLLQSDALYGIN
ncbi:protein DMP7-like [Primulina huaijiensis]|uniref:protein DMP7-like n=1 Tax=Primulina huaijiensis TaxID=1492673 RepID=UPI003CC6E1A6